MVDDTIKGSERAHGLVKRDFVAGLVHAQKGELAVLADFAVFGAVDDKGGVAGGVEFLGVGVFEGERDGLAAEPIADVICVSVDKGDANTVAKDLLEVGFVDRVDKVACGLEGVGNGGVRLGVVKVDPNGLLSACGVEKINKVSVWGGIVVWVTDIVDAAASVGVVGPFDVVTAHVGGFSANIFADGGGPIGLPAVVDLVKAAVGHEAGKFHVLVYSLIDGLYSVSVVDRELWVVWSLNRFVNDTVDYAKGIKVELDALGGAVGNFLVLHIEVVVESRAVMTAVRLGPQVESLLHLSLALDPVV